MRPGFIGRLAGLALSAAFCHTASAQAVLSTTSSTRYAVNGAANVVVDSALSLTGSSSISKVTVSVSTGFQSGDVLAASSLPSGVTASYNSTSGVLTLSGPASAAAYQTALRTVALTLSSSSAVTRSVTFTVGDLLAFTNGHFYKYVTTTMPWTSAKDSAALASNKYYGLTGYLATIGSDAENTFITQKLSADAWIGASDNYLQINTATGTTTYASQTAAEGNWYWVTGPEKGTKFSTGSTVYNGQYSKWNNTEPNNYNGSEDYAEIFSSGAVAGAWNDLNNSGTLLGYVVEYGGTAGDPTVQLSGSRNVTIQATSITGTYNSGSYSPGAAAKVVDNSLSLYASGNITDARATISTGKQSGDVLSFNSASLPTNVTGTYNSTTGVLSFTGTASAASWQSLLRTVTFAATGGSNINRVVTFSLGSNVAGSNGHFYQYVASSNISWSAAKTAASGQNYYGLTGYLATITSADENAFITQKLSSDGWIGASDDYAQINAATGATTYADQTAAEGKWYWVTGPEKGTQFSQGNGSPVAVNSQYMNWNGAEPNNSAGSENYAQIYSASGTSGKWNDLNGTSQNGYVVEYGGISSDPAVTLASSSLLTVGTALPIRSLSLTAKAQQGAVALAWETLGEKDVRSYRVERSGNGRDFQELGELASQGNGNHRYESLDAQPLPGTGYYRIRSLEADGSASYSSLVSVRTDGGKGLLRVFPNPATAQLRVARADGAATAVSITDLFGNRVLQAGLSGTLCTLDIQALPAGTYFLRLTDGGEAQSIRFVKQ